MEWATIVPGILAAILAAIGIPMALRKRKQESTVKRDEFLSHIQTLKIDASLLEKGSDLEKIGLSQGWWQRSEGLIEIKDKNYDFINIVSISSQYGVTYFVDYLVRRANISTVFQTRTRKKTGSVKRKSSTPGARTKEIQWKGDITLSQALNLDYRLKDLFLQTGPEEIKSSIQIYPEPKHEYSRIRTAYIPPSSYYIDAINIIAGYIKSSW